MCSTAYQSVNNIDIERPPDFDYEAMARQLHSDGRRDNNFDSECGLVDGGGALSSEPEGEKHASYVELGPGFVSQESWVIKLLSWTWEIILTVLPLFFICVSILALKLNEQVKSTSTYGGKLQEIMRLGPTIYPILFAMVASRFYKNVARWRLERPYGITVSSLEQIIGSQSFASALERFIIIRARLLLGALILWSWAMSPLGGQSSSRLLRVDGMKYRFDKDVYYDNRVYQDSIYYDMDTYRHKYKDIITTIYSASLLLPKQQQRSSMDLLGRPKIPQWPWEMEQEADESWRKVDQHALQAENDYYTSLIGVNIQGLNLNNNSTQYEIDVDSGYIHFNCSKIARTESREDMERISFPPHKQFYPAVENLWKLYEKAMDGKDRAQSFMSIPVHPTPISTSGYLLYASRGNLTNREVLTVFNCTTTAINLRTNLMCTAQGCSPQRQHRIPTASPTNSVYFHRRQGSLHQVFEEWPNMTGATGKTSATENYIANDEAVYGDQQTQNWTGIDTEMFSRRLTTAFNTVWDAGMDPYNFTKSSLAMPENPADFWTNRTNATITTTEPTYYVNKLWAVILILTTTFLQILAICGLVLKCLIRGPDILGFASSLTRDNAFVPVLGGSFQGGAERARSLGKMRVQLADVQPRESRGYIALSAVPPVGSAGAGDKAYEEEGSLGQLKEKRMYM